MRKNILLLAVLCCVLAVSCKDEWDPVVTFKYDDPGLYKPSDLKPNCTIADLKKLYVKTGKPVKIDPDLIIKGQVVSEDRSGNIYKSLYIQDETGAIELKIGKNGLYNDYKPGQWIVVRCSGLTLGNYNGMLQLGAMRNRKANGEDATDTNADGENSDKYETTYLEVNYLIDTHILRAEMGEKVKPKLLTEEDLKANITTIPVQQGPDFGCLVTLKGLKYNSADGTPKIFLLTYYGSDHDNDRVFLSDETYGVTTWAMSKNAFLKYIESGKWDYVSDVLNHKAGLIKNASAYAVSQYFMMGKTEVQIRTSGYARFADLEIDPDVLSGKATIDVTGILTNYSDAIQFTLIDEDSIVVNK